MDEILNLIESVSEGFPSYTYVWGKSDNYLLFFGNYCRHWSPSCLKHTLNKLMKLSEYQRSRSYFDLGHSKVKICFSKKKLGDLKPKFI